MLRSPSLRLFLALFFSLFLLLGFYFFRRHERSKEGLINYLEVIEQLSQSDNLSLEEQKKIFLGYLEKEKVPSAERDLIAFKFVSVLQALGEDEQVQKELEELRKKFLAFPVIQASILFQLAQIDLKQEDRVDEGLKKLEIVAQTDLSPLKKEALISQALIYHKRQEFDRSFDLLKKVARSPSSLQSPYEEIIAGVTSRTLARQLLSYFYPERLSEI